MFEEMKARIKEDDESVPYLYNGYYNPLQKQGGYPYLFSKKESLEAAEEIMFDCND
jgi:oligopeptidase B